MIKRSLDMAVAGLGLVLLAPVLALVAAIVALNLGRPILFRQQRAGLHGRTFEMVKFRSMTDRRGTDGCLLPDGERLTRFGRFLRATSLDELPQLWNVLCGDMSLVGPRPLLVDYLPLYSPEQARRHNVRPGLTGWAQVHGRNGLGWHERFVLDVWYVDNRSVALDLRILGMTVGRVLAQDGVSAAGEPTMPRFIGRGEGA